MIADPPEYEGYCILHMLEYKSVPYYVYMHPDAGVFVTWGEHEENCAEFPTWAKFQENMPTFAAIIIGEAQRHIEETLKHMTEMQINALMRDPVSKVNC